MKRTTTVIMLIASLCFVPLASANAQNSVNNLGTCMIDSLNGKERKQLAQWIFFAMAAHPEIKTYSNVSTKDLADSDEKIGGLITRLLTVNCPEQLKLANAADPLALQKSFELVGQVAMQELMTNAQVMSALTGYTQHTDIEKINQALMSN
ncbi:hypothetical protein GCM10009111_28340 [Colwellia asteriadis]|uniref:Uncharacterized protein n=1 Tax=Colwellia asteriadis TaxID=517723 RepID=A0ABN1LA62_9GAMM